MATKTSKQSATRLNPSRSGRRPAVAAARELPVGIAVAILLVVALAFFSGHIFGSSWLWEDFAEFVYPNEVFAARSFAAGILPFWNPYTFNGMPFLADLQIGFFYPANLLMYLLSGGELSSWLAQLFVVLHYPVAMLGAWALARGLGVRSWGAVFTGISYGLSGMLVAHMIHPNMLHHLAWFPLVVHLFRRGVVERSWLAAIASGLILGGSLLSGHPQSALYIVLYLFVLTLVLLAMRARAGRDAGATGGGLVTAALCALVTVVIGVGVFAIQLLPSQELAGLSERATMSYERSVEGAMTGGQLLTLVVPKVYGEAGAAMQSEAPFWLRQESYYYWETVVYAGVVTLLLAVIGLVARRLGAIGWFFGGMAVFGLLYGLGDAFLVHPLFARLPLFDTFRMPVRMAMFLSLGAAVLAGAGLDRLVDATRDGGLSRPVLVTGGIIVVLGLLTVAGVLPGMLGVPTQIADAIAGTGAIALLVGAAATATAWAAVTGRLPGTAAAVILVTLGVIDLFVFGIGQNSAEADPQEIYATNDRQFAAFKAQPPDSLFRMRMRSDGAMLMQRNQGPYSGIMLFEGYNPLLLQRRVPPASTPEKAFDFMNIRYSVQADTGTGAVGIVERPSAYPHARMMYDARIGSTEQVLSMLKDSTIDFGRTVLLEKDPGLRLDGAGSGSARFTRYDASELELAVTTDRPGILLLSEVWYPAWKVFVDGQPAELLVADYSLRGVAIPAGQHTVRMVYESDAFSSGMWITLATILASVVAVVLLWWRRRGAVGGIAVET